MLSFESSSSLVNVAKPLSLPKRIDQRIETQEIPSGYMKCSVRGSNFIAPSRWGCGPWTGRPTM